MSLLPQSHTREIQGLLGCFRHVDTMPISCACKRCWLVSSLTMLSCVSFLSDVLALPIFKQEESNLPPDSENKILPFQYVLCAATSPAIKLHDETLTYLNQG